MRGSPKARSPIISQNIVSRVRVRSMDVPFSAYSSSWGIILSICSCWIGSCLTRAWDVKACWITRCKRLCKAGSGMVINVGAFRTRSEKSVKKVPFLEKPSCSCLAYMAVSASTVAKETSFGPTRTAGPVRDVSIGSGKDFVFSHIPYFSCNCCSSELKRFRYSALIDHSWGGQQGVIPFW